MCCSQSVVVQFPYSVISSYDRETEAARCCGSVSADETVAETVAGNRRSHREAQRGIGQAATDQRNRTTL